MANIDDVAIFHDVLFALDVELAGFLELYFGGMSGLGGAAIVPWKLGSGNWSHVSSFLFWLTQAPVT